MDCKLLLGIAIEDFVYGQNARLRIVELDESYSNDKESNLTSNLSNKSLDGIKLGHYECTNEMVLKIPDYMAYEHPCGCSKCSPNKRGSVGEKFLIINLPENSFNKDFIILTRL